MAEFNIYRFLDLAGGVKIDDLDWELCARIGISDVEERILRYMGDTESHTILYMRDLLAGHSTRDPEITAFLSAWVYEELCHGRAISRLLKEVGRPDEEDRYTKVTAGSSVREFVEAALSHAAAYLSPRFIAVHMTWGAINEATAAAAYQQMEERTANPVLAKLINRMARQERRHMAFYWHQAQKRMKDDPAARKLVNFAIKRFWTLVGSGVGGDENLAFISAHLFADEAARAALVKAEENIRELPGMEWFDLLTKQSQAKADEWVARHGPGRYVTNDAQALAAGVVSA
jgi:1,2-phenylacetyl-CoA epoxidase catalytic subunit